jgi:HSP20 family molecular chaperone IbpA
LVSGGLEVFRLRFHLNAWGLADPAVPGEAYPMTGDPRRWMWAEACAMIERAEQMHRQFFQPGTAALSGVNWEPPVDIFESERDLLIVVALPGVASPDIEISSGPDMLIVAGVRRLPAEACGLAIQRLEIPQGRFERRIALPSARWELRQSTLAEGCLLISLTRQGKQSNKQEPVRARVVSRSPRTP